MGSITLEIGGYDQDFIVHEAFLTYLSDFSPEEEWDLRGYTGHKNEQAERENRKQQALEHFLDNPENDEVLQKTLRDLVELFRRLIDVNTEYIAENHPEMDFYFVIGHMRSGGTYLLKELLKSDGLSINNYTLGMIHDGCPAYGHLINWRNNDQIKNQLFFDFAQYIYWMSKKFSDRKRVFKKRIAFAHALPLLDLFFGDQAHYIFTIRHPAESAESFAEMENIQARDSRFNHKGWKKTVMARFQLNESTWGSLSYYEQFLYHWASYYFDIARDANVSGSIHPLYFGEDYQQFLNKFSGQIDSPYELEEFKPKSRNSRDNLSAEVLERCLKFLNSKWSESGLNFPELK